MQSIQLLAVLACGVPLMIFGLLRLLRVNGSSLAVATLIGLVAAAVGTAIVLVLRLDLVPDDAEAVILPFILLVVGPALIVVALLRRYRR